MRYASTEGDLKTLPIQSSTCISESSKLENTLRIPGENNYPIPVQVFRLICPVIYAVIASIVVLWP